jgi:O-methyltransferase
VVESARDETQALPESARRYLDLLKICLTRYGLEAEWQYVPYRPGGNAASVRLGRLLKRAVAARGLRLVRPVRVDLDARREGRDWPATAETMIGLRRLENLEECVAAIERDGVPGDLIETGVWRGGASIFLRALLLAHGDTDRTVWLADSFQGLPKPDAERYPRDAGDRLWEVDYLRVSLDEVRGNFARYGLLDDQVRFLPGWFRDTLPGAPIERLALIRLDGDLYESTMQALDALYPKLSAGGFVVVDDYDAVPNSADAVHDFRERHGIDDELVRIDWTGVYWRRRQA